MQAQFFEHHTLETFRLDLSVEKDTDITGCSFRWALYNASGALVAEKTTASGITITSPKSYSVDLTDGTVAVLAEGSYKYEIRITAPANRATLRAYGPWVIRDTL